MKFFNLSLFVIVFFLSCSQHSESTFKTSGIGYNADEVKTSNLRIDIQADADTTGRQVSAKIKLINSGSTLLDISDITIATQAGIRSLPQKGFAPFRLGTTDTTISVIFQPVNDAKIFQVTGLDGPLKPNYTVAINYQETPGNSPQTVGINLGADTAAYNAYLKHRAKNLSAYSFDTKTKFNQTQKQYLQTLKQVHQPPFVFLSEQEIAVSGLNFRLKNHIDHDTLYAELFMVNHADFQVKVDTAAFNITTAYQNGNGIKNISLEKISGLKQNLTMVEKGDRILIYFKKYLKVTGQPVNKLTLHLNKVFMLSPKVSLFNQDATLVPVVFK